MLFHSNNGYVKVPGCYVYTYIASLIYTTDSLVHNGFRVIVGSKAAVAWCGVALTIHSYLGPKLKKEQSYTPTPPLGLHGLF